MSDQEVPIVQDGDPPPEPASETAELLAATSADGDSVPDTSDGVQQHHQPVAGAPA